MILTFGKFKGHKLSNTPQWYRNWIINQDWFIKKFLKRSNKNPQNLYKSLVGWDGYGSRGQAAYDAIFEMEKNEGINRGEECMCGLPKDLDEDYCCGDHCRHNC